MCSSDLGADSFSLGRYWSSPSGSGTYRGGDLGPDQVLSPPISFGTPGRPNALYAFPRRDANGNIVPAMAVHGPSGRGTIYTTPAGLETLRNSELYVHSASAETFTPSDRVLAYGDPAEIVSQSTPVDIRTSRVKDPEGFVRSQHDIVVLPHEDDIRKKFAEHKKNPNPDLSVTISIGDE